MAHFNIARLDETYPVRSRSLRISTQDLESRTGQVQTVSLRGSRAGVSVEIAAAGRTTTLDIGLAVESVQAIAEWAADVLADLEKAPIKNAGGNARTIALPETALLGETSARAPRPKTRETELALVRPRRSRVVDPIV